MTDAFERFCADLRTYRDEHPEQRDGQAHFNALHLAHPDLTAPIRGELRGRDPFYRDANIPAFMEYVREHLEGKHP